MSRWPFFLSLTISAESGTRYRPLGLRLSPPCDLRDSSHRLELDRTRCDPCGKMYFRRSCRLHGVARNKARNSRWSAGMLLAILPLVSSTTCSIGVHSVAAQSSCAAKFMIPVFTSVPLLTKLTGMWCWISSVLDLCCPLSLSMHAGKVRSLQEFCLLSACHQRNTHAGAPAHNKNAQQELHGSPAL